MERPPEPHGSRAIGRGIGPALELRDVQMVLRNDPEVAGDLRDKALRFAAEILSFDPAIGDRVAGRRRAELLLQSGAAMERFQRIVAAQGASHAPEPRRLTHVMRAPHASVVRDVDWLHIAGIARRTSAPVDRWGGIDLAIEPGARLKAGEPLYTIRAGKAAGLEAAVLPWPGRIVASA